MLSQPQLVDLLRGAGLRVTRRQLCVAEAGLNSHGPLAMDQICVQIRDQFPTIPRASIQSTLGALEKCGLIHNLPFQKHPRYEANLEPDVNLVCTRCGMVRRDKTGQKSVYQLIEQVSCQSSFQVNWQRELVSKSRCR